MHNQPSRFSNSTPLSVRSDSVITGRGRSRIDRTPSPLVSTAVAVAFPLAGSADHRRSGAVRLWWMMLMSVAVWCVLAGTASAQRFDTFELDEAYAVFKDPKRAGELERSVSQLKTARDLAKVEPSVVGKAKFYLEKYIPWKLTQKENLPSLSRTIEELLKDVDGAQRSGSAGARTLLASTFIGMKALAEGNYMPAVRINAINALARLNERPLDIGAGRPPLPLRYSYPILMKLYADENENEGVRAAALHGINHYVQFAFPAISAEDRTKLTDEMNKLLASDPPEGRDPQAHAYLQRFGVDILNYLRAPNDAALGTQLISISTAEKNPDLIALYSASKLGGFNKELQGKVNNPQDITKQWSLRAFNAVESELARFASQKRPAPARSQPPNPIQYLEKNVAQNRKPAAGTRRGMGGAGMAGGMDMGMEMGMDPGMEAGMMGGGMEMGMDMMEMGMEGMMGNMAAQIPPQPPEVDLSRRKLSFVLQQLLRGATGSPKGETGANSTGLIAGVADPERETVKKWVTSILSVKDAINDDSLSTLELWLAALEAQRPVLGRLAGIESKQFQDPDKIEAGPRLPGLPGMGMPGMGLPSRRGAAAAEPAAGAGLPAAAPAAATPPAAAANPGLPGLPGMEQGG